MQQSQKSPPQSRKLSKSFSSRSLSLWIAAGAVVAWMGVTAPAAEADRKAASTRPNGSVSKGSAGSESGVRGSRGDRGGRTVAHRGSHRGRRHGSHGHRYRGHRHSRSHLSFLLGYGYGYYGYPYRYYSPYYGYYPYYYPAYHPRYRGYYPRRGVDQVGAVDVNVRPKKAQVHLNGRYIGTAGKFDGYPDYLWLPKGQHQLIFYFEGLGTVVQEVEVLPGVTIDVNLELAPGESVPVEELAVERSEPLYAINGTNGSYDEGEAETPERRWKRWRKSRRADAGQDASDAEDAPLDVRGEPGRLVLQIEPADASVYLDGRFLGTAGELSRLHAGLLVDSGEHVLELVRPGYDPQQIEFTLADGEEELIELAMDS